MISLKSTIREKTGSQNYALRGQGLLPAVLYGDGIKNINLSVNFDEFEEVYKEAGESSLIELHVGKDKYNVLVHQVAHDPVSDDLIHVDFFKPSTKKKVEAEIPLVFEGVSIAVKDLGGVFVRELQTLHVKGLAHELPREIKVSVDVLNTFEDKILVKDLEIADNIESLRDGDAIVAHVTAPTKMEEEVKPAVEGEEGEEGATDDVGEGKEGEATEESKTDNNKDNKNEKAEAKN